MNFPNVLIKCNQDKVRISLAKKQSRQSFELCGNPMEPLETDIGATQYTYESRYSAAIICIICVCIYIYEEREREGERHIYTLSNCVPATGGR